LLKASNASQEESDIFQPHHSLYARELIEQVSNLGTDALNRLSDALNSWLKHQVVIDAAAVPTPDDLIIWSPEKAKPVMDYLAAKPMETWASSDYSLLVDYLTHSHFPAVFPMQVAQLGVHKAVLMGKVQAVTNSITEGQVSRLLAHFDDISVRTVMDIPKIHAAAMDYAEAVCCDHVTGFVESVRHQLKQTIIEHQKEVLIEGNPTLSLQSKLLDNFGDLNKDWRRIAVTETGEMVNQGVVMATPAGRKLKRIEQYRGVCPFCKKIDGVIAAVVDPDKEDKNWDTEIWAGKNNVGRSSSPYKRVGKELVLRLDAERWKLPSGLAHPHCRGVWMPVAGQSGKDEFSDWLFKFMNPDVKQDTK
jgi:hypothetical protein